MIGLIFGYIFVQSPQTLKIFSKKWIFFSSILQKVLIPPIIRLYLQLNPTPSPFISAIIGTFLKHHDGFHLCIIFLHLLPNFKSNNSIFKILEKLFVAAFFSHIAVTKIFIVNTSVLLEMSAMNVVSDERM